MSEEAGGRADVVDGIIARWAVELPEAAGMPLELYKRAARLTSILDRAVYAQVERLGLTRAEFDILATMRRADAPHRLTPSELSQGLLLSSGGTSNVLRRLTQAGLVERHGNAGDRRSSWVQLTDLGVEKAELAVRLAARATAQALRDVAPGTGHTAADALRDVLLALDDVDDASLDPAHVPPAAGTTHEGGNGSEPSPPSSTFTGTRAQPG
ncbi:DNA-binding MarR family transcriptional regulator [Lipingzhangella halophila]|uniref:DNA-binding MarR family transcriptional regulator n=1 Tax=Lipingzhangella halophila TaxID=1783352 RepID=A0A7W7W4P5_9ACTN|nr:MarR family transcriptional regulator [Lipingzhangella halophila]MBB4933044.1 DNA-binding MarR family transcriptional regulator [Lipingzhangella halophila]